MPRVLRRKRGGTGRPESLQFWRAMQRMMAQYTVKGLQCRDHSWVKSLKQ